MDYDTTDCHQNCNSYQMLRFIIKIAFSIPLPFETDEPNYDRNEKDENDNTQARYQGNREN